MDTNLAFQSHYLKGKEDVFDLTRGILKVFAVAAEPGPGSFISQESINKNLVMVFGRVMVKDTHIFESDAQKAVLALKENEKFTARQLMDNDTYWKAIGRHVYITKFSDAIDSIKNQFRANPRYGEALEYLRGGLKAAHDTAITMRDVGKGLVLYEIPYVVEATAPRVRQYAR